METFFFFNLSTADSYFGGDESAKKKIKRVRTAFTEEQLEVLQRNFEIDSNPDGQDLERIALNAGLSKRVTQVWFQNARARQKKHTHLGKRKGKYTLLPEYIHLVFQFSGWVQEQININFLFYLYVSFNEIAPYELNVHLQANLLV